MRPYLFKSLLTLLPILSLSALTLAFLTPTPNIQFVQLPAGAIQPQVIRDGKGKIHVLYFKGKNSGGDLFYSTYSADHNSFSDPLCVTQHKGSAMATGTIRGGQLAIGKEEQVHVVWNSAYPEKFFQNGDSIKALPLWYTRLNDQKTAFEKPINMIENAFGLDGGSSIAADSKGNVHIAWHAMGKSKGEEYRRIWYRHSPDGGKSFSPEMPINAEGAGVCGCCGMHTGLDEKKAVFMLYRSAGERKHRDIHILRPSSKSFSDEIIHTWEAEACPMSSMHSFSSSSKTGIAWENDGKVFWKSLSSPKVNSPVEQLKAKHGRLAYSSNGLIGMSWTENTGWNKGGDLAYEIYNAKGKSLAVGKKKDAIPVWGFPTIIGHGDGFLIFY